MEHVSSLLSLGAEVDVVYNCSFNFQRTLFCKTIVHNNESADVRSQPFLDFVYSIESFDQRTASRPVALARVEGPPFSATRPTLCSETRWLTPVLSDDPHTCVQ